MISYEAAQQIIGQTVQPLGKVRRSLDKLLGMVLAESIQAGFDLPRFDNSAVDGYGVKISDLQKVPTELNCIGTIQAGDGGKRLLKSSETVRIFTGATVPPSVEAVVMQEVTEAAGDKIRFHKNVTAGDNIRRKGEEFRKGQTVIDANTLITPPVIGLLANLGYASALAYRKPKVALISTGNELIAPGKPLKPGQIYDSNTYAMAAALKAIGVEQIKIIHARDSRNATQKAFEQALKQSDVVISLGGISVGAFDFVKDVAEGLGIETLFWRIAIKPGKPVYFGRKGRKVIFGLPGNPVSALVTYHQLVQPALLKMMGCPLQGINPLKAELSQPLRKKPGRQEFVRGLLTTQNGRYKVTPAIGQDSHMLGGLAVANCLIDFPVDSETLEQGASVAIDRLTWTRPFQ